MFTPSTNNPNGVQPHTNEFNAYARGDSFLAGECGVLDFENFAGGVSNNKVGDPNSGFSSIVRARPLTQKYGVGAMFVEAVAEQRSGRAILSGDVTAWVSGNVVKGTPLTISTLGRRLVPCSTTGEKVFAIALEASSGVARVRVLFDGEVGMGTFVS